MVRVPTNILDQLLKAPVPVASVSETAIDALRTAGASITQSDGAYVLDSLGNGGAALAAALDSSYTVEYRETVDSTNRLAREFATAGDTDLIVLAAEQTGGRGRRNRRWESPQGGVWMSITSRPNLQSHQRGLVTFAAAVAILEAIEAQGGTGAIKWPNDVLVAADDQHRKVAGVLTEAGTTDAGAPYIVVGIGVNAAIDADSLPSGATSLQAHLPAIDRTALAAHIVDTYHYLRGDPDAILEAWQSHTMTLGRQVRVTTDAGEIEGEAITITDAGALVIRTDSGIETVPSGDCEHLHQL